MKVYGLLFPLMVLVACKGDSSASDSGASLADDDRDGITSDLDCDDADPNIGGPTSYLLDVDQDGFGDDATLTEGCSTADAVTIGGDCDDAQATVNPGAAEACDGIDNDCDGLLDGGDDNNTGEVDWYRDEDTDGYGDPGDILRSCDPPVGYVTVGDDCDDTNASIFPDVSEVCDGVDNDCDGLTDDDDDDIADQTTWYIDYDGDSYGSDRLSETTCAAPAGYVDNADDCDDAEETALPGGVEVCDDLDNDCDGVVDEPTAVDALLWYQDADLDGFGDEDFTTVSCDAPSGYVENDQDCDDEDFAVNPYAVERCDGLDNDCNGSADGADATDVAVWYRDADKDGYGDSSKRTLACTQPTGSVSSDTDCDDTDKTINPGATEVCDGDDNNCDGSTDGSDAVDRSTWYADMDADGYGVSTSSSLSCTQPSGSVSSGSDCDDTDKAVHPGATEVCDGDDNNCDGKTDGSDAADASVWYADADSDGYGDATSSSLACTQPSGSVSTGTDCDDSTKKVYPNATEVCDDLDNNCDGSIDGPESSGKTTWYADTDSDGYGDPSVSFEDCDQPTGYIDNPDDCDDSDPIITDCVCTLSSVATPVLTTTDTWKSGAYLTDPLETLGAGLVWTISNSAGTTVVQWPSTSALVSGSGGTTITLPGSGFEGTGHVVYGGYLYYVSYNSNTIVKFDLSTMSTVASLTISDAGYHNTYDYRWGGFTDIDLAVDENGLWVLYATSANGGKMVISRIDESSFSITKTWNTASSVKTIVGNAFMICGVMYTTASYSATSTSINYAYDTNTSTGTSLSIAFTNPGSYNSHISYNPSDGKLYSWDNQRLQTYALTIY